MQTNNAPIRYPSHLRYLSTVAWLLRKPYSPPRVRARCQESRAA